MIKKVFNKIKSFSFKKEKTDKKSEPLSLKEISTAKKEPWVAVIQTHINKQNVRNGFFELDWNEYFILQLKEAGYYGNTEEEIVDAWFSELCNNVGSENGINMENRGSGFVNKALRDDGRSEIG